MDMEYKGFLALLRKRRAIRKWKLDPIPEEHIDKIIEAARWSMSGANGQPWEFVVVRDKETKGKIAAFYAETETRFWNIERTRIEELRHNALRGVEPPSRRHAFKDAPVLIVVCGDPRTFMATVLGVHFYDGDWSVFWMNLANACQNLQLAAASLGLATTWVSVSNDWEWQIKNLLGIPEFFRVRMLVPVGYPAYEPPSAYRRELREILHYERYDPSKLRSDDDIFNFLLDLREKTRAGYIGEG